MPVNQNIIAQITALNTTTMAPVTLYLTLASQPGSAPGAAQLGNIVVDGRVYLPVITTAPTKSISLPQDGKPADISISYGTLDIRFGDYNRSWINLEYDGAPISIWRGTGSQMSAYTQVFGGLCGQLEATYSAGSIDLRGAEALLAKDLLNVNYLGTGGAEGGVDQKGNPKPWCSGFCENIEAVLIDAAKFIYQFHGYGACQDVNFVYENAIDLGACQTTVPTDYNTLNTMALTPGQWAKCPALGMFRLGAEPAGTITADVSGAKDGATFPARTGAIVSHVMRAQGTLPSTSIKAASATALDLAFPFSWCAYITEQTSVGDFARDALKQQNGYLLPGGDGIWRFGRIKTSKTPLIINVGGGSLPLAREFSREKWSGTRVYQVQVGGRRAWYQNGGGEISSLLSDTAEDLDALSTEYTNITSDNMLSKAEKSQVISDVSVIQAEISLLTAQATAFGLTAQGSALQTAETNLINYLSSLSPSWNDVTVDTPVAGPNLRQKFIDYYNAKSALGKAIADYAASTATWGNVTGPGTPDASATRNVHRGVWATGQAYLVGDDVTWFVTTWRCVTAHTSSSTNGPPGSNWLKTADLDSLKLSSRTVAYPVTSTSTSISVQAFTGVLSDGTSVSIPAMSLSGLTASKSYAVFWSFTKPVGQQLVCAQSPATDAFANQLYLYIDTQYTSDASGTYPTPPAPPGGYRPPGRGEAP